MSAQNQSTDKQLR